MSCQVCLKALRRNTEPSDPPFYDDNFNSLPTDDAVQAIITTYKFYCDCVNITSWETYVHPAGPGHNMKYDITFQVWRPSPTVQDNGCYSLVGQNIFTSVILLQSGLVQLTPTPPTNTIITAQSRDVLGYYTKKNGGNPNEGIQLERLNNYNNNIIWWYRSENHPCGNECSLQVGTESDRVLRSSTGAAPMLKISTSKLK